MYSSPTNNACITLFIYIYMVKSIECFHSRGQHLCKFIGTKESVCIRKEFNSHRTSLGHQHGRHFIVLGHQYGRRDVMWKHSIEKGSLNSKFNYIVNDCYINLNLIQGRRIYSRTHPCVQLKSGKNKFIFVESIFII